MLAEQMETRLVVQQMVAGITRDFELREDLVQEGLIHIWLREERCPGQTKAWYLQSCRFHLSNFLRMGRSVDSWKHHQPRLLPLQMDELLPAPGNETTSGDTFFGPIGAREIMLLLSEWLTSTEKKVLGCLADGLSAREIAKRLNISHTLVNRHRRRIA